MNAISADFGHGRGASQFILSLLLVSRPLASSLPLLVPLCLRNTHLFVSTPKSENNNNERVSELIRDFTIAKYQQRELTKHVKLWTRITVDQ